MITGTRRFCWVKLGNWGLGVKWYSRDGILAFQIGAGQLEIEIRRRW